MPLNKIIASSVLALSLGSITSAALAHEDVRLESWLNSEKPAITRHFEEAQIYAQLGNMWKELGETERGAKLFEKSKQASTHVSDAYVRDVLIGHTANEWASTGNFDQALATLDNVKDTEVWVKTAWKLIGKLAKAKQQDAGIALLKRAEQKSHSVKEPVLRAELLSGTGATYRYFDKQHGENLVYEAYGIAQMLADPYERALMFNETGAHLMDIGHRDLALDVFKQVDLMVNDIKNPLLQTKALAMLGGEQAEKNLRDKAVPALDRARRIGNALPDSEDKYDVLSEVARNYGQSHTFEPGIATAKSISDAYYRVEGYIRIAKNMYRVGDKKQALALLKDAEADAQKIRSPYRQAIVLRKLASEYVMADDKTKAGELLTQAETAMAKQS